ncbi:MAG: glutathione-regulated potassium-efflux system protein KefC [Burkholderiales bacterium]
MLSDVLIFLVAAVVFVPLAQRLKLGAVLGYLIAGVVIGPFVLGLVSNVDSIRQISDLGVVLMLFVIGLELEPKRLAEMRKTVFSAGSFQVAFSGAALGGGLLLFGLDVKAALIGGFALALSSTAIAVAMMTERNLLPTPSGQMAFGISLFQDLAAIPLLTVIPLIGVAAVAASSGGAHAAHATGWLAVAEAVGAIVSVVLLGLYAMRPLLRLIAATGLREVFTAFALLIVLGIAQLMSFVGLSAGLGAFIAGVLLASSEYRHALETDIEPFKGLLLGLFFVSVGMAGDFGLLQTHPATIAALLLGFMVLKLTTLWVVARLFGVNVRERWLFSILITQGSEFAFVLFLVARDASVLTQEWAALLTMTVALSMAVTPLLLVAYEWWAARRECAADQRPADAIDEKEARVIIAGFGRFGQIIGRLLFANGINAVVLDHDPDQIELLRRFGYKVFYGDATRLDLLHAAGADRATLLINAIDDVEDSLMLTDLVNENFPHLKMIARARNVRHYVELRKRGVRLVERELFESSVRAGRHALEAMGFDRFRARELADTFRRHNIRVTEAAVPLFGDDDKLVSAAKAGRDELAEQMARDRARFDAEHEAESQRGWH